MRVLVIALQCVNPLRYVLLTVSVIAARLDATCQACDYQWLRLQARGFYQVV